jgi:hypothetical protein
MADKSLDEIAHLLNSGGVLDKLAATAQEEREFERAELLVKLAEVEKADSIAGKKLAVEIVLATQALAQADDKIRPAKARLLELSQQSANIGATAQKLRGKLRRLADPQLDQGARLVDHLFDKARNSFAGHDVVQRIGRSKRKVTVRETNAEQISEVMAKCRAAQLQIDALRESPRPDNLVEVLAAITDPIRADVRRLAGL